MNDLKQTIRVQVEMIAHLRRTLVVLYGFSVISLLLCTVFAYLRPC